MSIKVSTMKIMGNRKIKENRLPQFRDKQQNTEMDGSELLPAERVKFGYQTGRRVLPYLVQDIYSRKRKTEILKTIELENRHLKAVFLPEYGMRMFSLYSKDENRELLFRNPVLQFANLAIRDAWFAGGIEWNIGQLGHTFTTAESVYVAVIQDNQGKEFIRCYEYERCKGVYWQIDFHLEENAKYIAAYVKLINPREQAVPFYWWTNVAIPEEKNVRVFSSTSDVIYLDESSLHHEKSIKKMIYGKMPYLKSLPDKDASYSTNFNFSSEYFFQNGRNIEQTWEATVNDQGEMFYEYSSERLCYRKMFCWGMQQGGRHWKDYLSESEKGNYIEIQAGISPTQVHGIDFPAKATWDFVQIFGGTTIKPDLAKGKWQEAQNHISKEVKTQIQPSEVKKLLIKYRNISTKPIRKLLHMGSGFGAVEECRKEGITPKGMTFPDSCIGEKEQIWIRLIQEQHIEDQGIFSYPLSYMVDPNYKEYLKKAADQGGYTAKNLYGIYCLENGMTEEAIQYFKESIDVAENPLAYRNLFWAYRQDNPKLAHSYIQKALGMFGILPDREYVEEYTDFLLEQKMYKILWDYYHQLPKLLQQNQQIILNMIPTAVKLQKIDFLEEHFKLEFASIREGKRGLTEAYFAYQALVETKEKGIAFTPELVKKYEKLNQVPIHLDFRQNRSE